MSMHGFTVSMDVTKLLDILKTNREKHVKEFKEAAAAYRIKVVRALRKRAEAIESGSEIHADKFLSFRLPAPKSYADDYTEVIDMLEMCEDEVATLNNEQFKNWVKDDWNWSDKFSLLNSSYVGE